MVFTPQCNKKVAFAIDWFLKIYSFDTLWTSLYKDERYKDYIIDQCEEHNEIQEINVSVVWDFSQSLSSNWSL